MKRLIAILLAVFMLVLPIASCSNNGSSGTSDTTAGDTSSSASVNIDLTGYTIIRSETASADLKADINEMKKLIETKCGITLGYSDDWINRNETEPEDAKEIVVGINKRNVSTSTLASLPGSCYTVRLIGQRIVILGTDDIKTGAAIEYFLENYVAKASGTVIKMPSDLCYISEVSQKLDILSGGQSSFSVIYDDGLDNQVSSSDSYDRRDYEVEWTLEIANQLNSISGKKSVSPGTDWVKAGSEPDSNATEILVGYTNRPELAEVCKTLKSNEYTVCVKGNKIIIFGWNLTTLRLAVDKFLEYAKSSAVVNGTTKDLSIANDYKFVGSTDKWLVDIPEFEGGTFDSNYDANNGALALLYKETTKAAYDAYCTKLVGAGYTMYLENTIGENYFKTFTKGEEMIHVYFSENTKSVRIITDKSVTLPDIESDTVNKICDMSLTQMRLNYEAENFGMCYVITLEDGSFIVYDGGGAKGGDHTRLYQTLNKLNKRPDGKIVIAAWIITHPHWDHRSVLSQIFSTYGNDITLESIILNSPDVLEMYNSRDHDATGDTTIPQLAAKYKAKVVIPYTGQYLYIRNVRLDVLYTHEVIAPANLVYFNNSTIVTRLTVGGQTITFLGDIQNEGSTAMVNMYGSALKGDIVQVSHHGYIGATKETYQNIDPSVLLWPTSQSAFVSQTSKQNGNGYYAVDYHIRYKLNVKEIFVADKTNKTIPLPYTPESNTMVEWE